MPVETPIEIPEWDQSEQLAFALDLPDSLDMDGRTELKLLTKQQHLLDFQKQAVKAEYYPSLSLSGSYSYQGLANSFPVFKDASSGANWFDVATVGVSLKVPIFNGGATRARIRQADVELKK
jgi:Outer membrane protein